jgi:hypothetical protein
LQEKRRKILNSKVVVARYQVGDQMQFPLGIVAGHHYGSPHQRVHRQARLDLT